MASNFYCSNSVLSSVAGRATETKHFTFANFATDSLVDATSFHVLSSILVVATYFGLIRAVQYLKTNFIMGGGRLCVK